MNIVQQFLNTPMSIHMNDLERALTKERYFKSGLCKILGHKAPPTRGKLRDGYYTLIDEWGGEREYVVKIHCSRCGNPYPIVRFMTGGVFGKDDRTTIQRDELIDLSLDVVREVSFDNTFDVSDLRKKLDQFVSNYGLHITGGRAREETF